MQLLQINEPSPSSNRCASESRRVPQVLHRKQSICHLLPAARKDSCQPANGGRISPEGGKLTQLERFAFFEDLEEQDTVNQRSSIVTQSGGAYLSAAFARVRYIVLVHGRLGMHSYRLHIQQLSSDCSAHSKRWSRKCRESGRGSMSRDRSGGTEAEAKGGCDLDWIRHKTETRKKRRNETKPTDRDYQGWKRERTEGSRGREGGRRSGGRGRRDNDGIQGHANSARDEREESEERASWDWIKSG